MPAYERREIVGAAVATTITSTISNSDTSIPIAASTGWPTGGTGPWTVVIDRGTASEEQVDILSRSTLTLTVNTSGRAFNGTTAAQHQSGATIEVVGADKRIVDESNRLVNQLLGGATGKGYVPIASAANTISFLAPPTDGYPLVADSSQATGWRGGFADPTSPTYTPTLVQNVTVTKTVTFAEHLVMGKLVWWNVELAVTSAGTAGNAVAIGLPVAVRTGTRQFVGSGRIVDSGTAANSANVEWVAGSGASTAIGLVTAQAETGYGVAPNNALASGDIVIAKGWYVSA